MRYKINVFFTFFRQKEQQDLQLSQKVNGVVRLRLMLMEKLDDIIKKLNILQSRILDDELIR